MRAFVILGLALVACGDNIAPEGSDVSLCDACMAPEHAATTCDGTRCGFTCDAGYHACGPSCADDLAIETCATACAPCPAAPPHAAPTCDGEACGFACGLGFTWSNGACGPTPPRLIAPLSTATVTSRRPTLRWELADGTDGARVELCLDRSCTNMIATIDATGSVAPLADLPSGTVYWRLRGRVGDAVGEPSSTWQLSVGSRSTAIDTSWGTVLDLNGDGLADVAVGALFANDRAGAAHVYYGSASGITTSSTTSLAAPGTDQQDFGWVVASAGDVNGDGFADLVVGAPLDSNWTGAAYLYFGGPNGIGVLPARALIAPDGLGGRFGIDTAGVGDLNGDGYADVAVAADGVDGYTGHVYVYFGGPNGPAATPAISLTGPDGPGGYFGAVASAGDLDGDGHEDLVVTSRFKQRAYVYFGGAGGLTTTPLVIAPPAGAFPGFGVAAIGADFDGDGYADLAVGASYAAYVYSGGPAGLATMPLDIPNQGQEEYGTGLGAGDVDGDGYTDLIIGAPATTDIFVMGYANGSIDVIPGGASGLVPISRATRYAPDFPYFSFGQSVAGADIDGDGFADVIVGALGGCASLGCAYVYAGALVGIPDDWTWAIAGPDGVDSFFGFSID